MNAGNGTTTLSSALDHIPREKAGYSTTYRIERRVHPSLADKPQEPPCGLLTIALPRNAGIWLSI
ncbi:hypothetical protein AC579_7041 [Pseudocercospora musae]|uniref:Uncharacterized protein n=1 Tax=Pseudocercospora musae TaxID=113226 RepID=A0A139IAJ3_9PEZI|nr:hypothetical protein AC579_7041 [Pseudocercospora musae]